MNIRHIRTINSKSREILSIQDKCIPDITMRVKHARNKHRSILIAKLVRCIACPTDENTVPDICGRYNYVIR